MNTPINGIIFDLDGTVYLGEKALPHAVEAIQELRALGKRVLFVSNKPLEPGRVYAEKLSGLGIPTRPEEVITSAQVLGYHLSRTQPDLRLYVVGELPLINELKGFGLKVVGEITQDAREVIDPAGIDAVVIAFDRSLDYRKLNTAYQALVAGARFFATNGDLVCPMPGGAIPDAGGTLAALEAMTHRKVEVVFGKPSRMMLDAAAGKLNLPNDQCLMVGDRLETDIAMGQRAGMKTAVVLTGVTRREDLAGMASPPDFIFNHLGELLEMVKPK